MNFHKMADLVCIVTIMTLTFILRNAHAVLPDQRWMSDEMFVSPNYPNDYPANTERVWEFVHSRGIWAIDFLDFKLETSVNCKHDFLEIVDLAKDESEVVQLCGEIAPHIMYTTGQQLRISFKSDDFIQKKGFWLRVLHGTDKVSLQKQINNYHGNTPIQEGYKSIQAKDPAHHKYILEGLVTALVVCCCFFVCLVIWLATALCRRQRRIKLSNYQNFANLPRTSLIHNVPEIAIDSGRKYSKHVITTKGNENDETEHKSLHKEDCMHHPEEVAFNSYVDLKNRGACGNTSACVDIDK